MARAAPIRLFMSAVFATRSRHSQSLHLRAVDSCPKRTIINHKSEPIFALISSAGHGRTSPVWAPYEPPGRLAAVRTDIHFHGDGTRIPEVSWSKFMNEATDG